jgi:undecaprenyl diphosphate synthase
MIRTERITYEQLLLWQAAYTEFYFTDTFWPDFREENFTKL